MTTETTSGLGQLRRVRWAVRATLVLGVAASIAANILHADPNPISRTISAWPPLALLFTVELISRVPVHRRSLALVRQIATAVIAGIAAWVSYWHMVGVTARYGETGASPYLLPLSVDGLIVVASICLVELAGRIRDHETATATVPAPVAAPADTGAVATPTRHPTAKHPTNLTDPTSPASTPMSEPAPAGPQPTGPTVAIPSPAELAARIIPARPVTPAASGSPSRSGTRTTRRPAGGPTTPTAAQLAPSTIDSHVSESDAAQLSLPVPVSPDLLTRAAKMATEYHTEHGTPITAGQLAVRLQVSSEQAAQALAVLNPTNPTEPIATVNGNRPQRTNR